MALTTTALNASNVYGAMSKLANRGQSGQAGDAASGLAAGVKSPDFGAMLRDQMEREKTSGHRYVDLSKPRRKTGVKKAAHA